MIYYDDHLPPHFHAEYNEYEELIEIKALQSFRGSLPNKQRKKVMEWVRENQGFLTKKWNEFNSNN